MHGALPVRLVSIACCIGWSATLLVAPATAAADEPGVALAAPVASSTASPGVPFAGVWTDGPRPTEAAALDDLNAGWGRVTVIWSTVEPQPGTFDWTALDPSMAIAAGDGRRAVLALVRNNPTWAAASRCSVSSDAERQHLADFMAVLAGRYKGVVWQLYNEEDNTSPTADAQSNLGGCFGTLGPDGAPTPAGPRQYARTLEAASAAVRGVDPTAQLASGGVTSAGYTDQGGAFDRGFLAAVLAQLKQDDALASLDVVAVHYFSSQAFLYADRGTDLLGRLAQLKQDALNAGLTPDEVKPVIIDELSFTDSLGTSTSDAASAFNVAQQAYVPKALARATAAGVRAALWFWLQDASGGLGSDNAYGLKDRTGAPKPSYQALRTFISQITRTDQLVGRLDLTAVSPALEGYAFVRTDGRALQLVWANVPIGDPSTYSYVPDCQVAEVRDAAGNLAAFDAAANRVTLSGQPRYVVCAPSG